ncbi:uncharacterized protein Z518_09009 [Rhinocladiella mackenziei CBS 650.93]|uniref:Ig-like domain-containing protein n=1 Tax=Rhinocladiella mackenziei CBS 650.93 TaxID=1442369 RepID=A0A0D2I653_9EURO|nr:uncharacterized protein Z518_09009 [Rhinocladiella mackenziei CBS 650.93]KIX01284.1 hypothetical protein Z518_09009 [Rhinocladiella mackenziei CBS 650.93]
MCSPLIVLFISLASLVLSHSVQRQVVHDRILRRCENETRPWSYPWSNETSQPSLSGVGSYSETSASITVGVTAFHATLLEPVILLLRPPELLIPPHGIPTASTSSSASSSPNGTTASTAGQSTSTISSLNTAGNNETANAGEVSSSIASSNVTTSSGSLSYSEIMTVFTNVTQTVFSNYTRILGPPRPSNSSCWRSQGLASYGPHKGTPWPQLSTRPAASTTFSTIALDDSTATGTEYTSSSSGDNSTSARDNVLTRATDDPTTTLTGTTTPPPLWSNTTTTSTCTEGTIPQASEWNDWNISSISTSSSSSSSTTTSRTRSMTATTQSSSSSVSSQTVNATTTGVTTSRTLSSEISTPSSTSPIMPESASPKPQIVPTTISSNEVVPTTLNLNASTICLVNSTIAICPTSAAPWLWTSSSNAASVNGSGEPAFTKSIISANNNTNRESLGVSRTVIIPPRRVVRRNELEIQ